MSREPRVIDTCDDCAKVNAGPCPHVGDREAYVRELEERLRLACQPCAECGHVDWRELDDILGKTVVTRTFTGGAPVLRRRESGDELRMTQDELDESVAAFCDEDAERDAFEAQAALLDSPDVVSGARPVWPPVCPECGGRGEVAATLGQPGDGPMPCPRCTRGREQPIGERRVTTLPRGTCPVCGRDVALRHGRLVREHRPFNVERDSRRETGLGGASRPSGVCRGSGMVAS